MNKLLATQLLLLVTCLPALAHGKSAFYDIILTHAIVQFDELDSTLSIRPDSSSKDPAYLTTFDSLEFSWSVVNSQVVVYDFYNGSNLPTVLVWDSMYAVDTRGFLIDLVPSGVKLDMDLTAPPKKVGAKKRFQGGFLTMTRQDRYSGINNPILPMSEGDNRQGPFIETVPLMKGKNFKYTMAVRRGERLEQYTFTFLVRDAYIKK